MRWAADHAIVASATPSRLCSMTNHSAPFLVRFAAAADFAARRHRDQRRKGGLAEPYVNHVIEVACLVAEATSGEEAEAAIAALLHDTVEDTGTTLEEIEAAFGAFIAGIVAEVSDDKSLPKEERKRLQITHAASSSRAARLVKLADKIGNVRSLRDSPPRDWSLARRRAYLDWARAVVDEIRGTHDRLEAWFDEAHAEGIAALEEEERRSVPPPATTD